MLSIQQNIVNDCVYICILVQNNTAAWKQIPWPKHLLQIDLDCGAVSLHAAGFFSKEKSSALVAHQMQLQLPVKA